MEVGGGVFQLAHQTLELIVHAAPASALGHTVGDLRQLLDDGVDVLGVAVPVQAAAEEIDAVQRGVEAAGRDQVPVLVLLEAQADVHVVLLVF